MTASGSRKRARVIASARIATVVWLFLGLWYVADWTLFAADMAEGNKGEARWAMEREIGKSYDNVTAESRIHVSATSEEGTQEWTVERLALLGQVLDEQRALMTVTTDPLIRTMEKSVHVVGDRGLILVGSTTFDAKSASALVREVAHAASMPSEVQEAYEKAEAVAFAEEDGLRFASMTVDPERLDAYHFLDGLFSEIASCEVRCGFDADGHLARCEMAVEGLSSAAIEPLGSAVSLTWDIAYRDYGYTRVPDLGSWPPKETIGNAAESA